MRHASQRYTIKPEFVEGPSRNAGPLPLCYLCFLLFKFLCFLLSANLEAALGRPPCDTCRPTSHDQTGICRRGPSRNADPFPFVTFASFCSNFFAYFCLPTLKPLWGDHPATPASNVTRSNGNMSKDHRGMPVPCPFVTFASFCSNFFAYFCPPSKTICFAAKRY
jgi:hypothetical protein